MNSTNRSMSKQFSFAVLLLLCVGLSACSIEKRSESLTGPGFIESPLPGSGGGHNGTLSRVIGKWTGVQTPSCPVGCGEGPSSFDVEFKQSPADDLKIDADVRYLAANGAIYHGPAKGDLTVPNGISLTINPAENPGGTLCGYEITASLNAAGDRIEGSGRGVGSGPNCSHKVFTFWLTGRSQVLCDAAVGGYSGPNPFTLASSSDELAYVRANVTPSAQVVGLWTQPLNTFSWTADDDYPILVSMATNGTWWIYTNVCKGSSFHTHVLDGPDKSISHVTGFKVP